MPETKLTNKRISIRYETDNPDLESIKETIKRVLTNNGELTIHDASEHTINRTGTKYAYIVDFTLYNDSEIIFGDDLAEQIQSEHDDISVRYTSER